mgnify:CR=1 FL=1
MRHVILFAWYLAFYSIKMEGDPYPELIINEIGVNYNRNGFIEILSTKDFESHFGEKPQYGLLVFETTKVGSKRGTKMTAIIDLSSIIQLPISKEQYFLIGSPVESWLTPPIPANQWINTANHDNEKFRIYGMSNAWLNVRPQSIMAFVLTKSKPDSLQSLWNNIESGDFLEDKSDLADFIHKHQVDAVMIRGPKANMYNCKDLDKHIKKHPYWETRMSPKYLLSPNGDFVTKITWNRYDS